MAFVEIPLRARINAPRDGVTVAWAEKRGQAHAHLRIYIGGLTLAAMGGGKGKRVAVAYCADTNRLRIAPAAKGRKLGFAGKFISIKVPLLHVALAENKPVQTVLHTIEGGALILRLPEWAWYRGKQLAAEAAAKARGRIAA